MRIIPELERKHFLIKLFFIIYSSLAPRNCLLKRIRKGQDKENDFHFASFFFSQVFPCQTGLFNKKLFKNNGMMRKGKKN